MPTANARMMAVVLHETGGPDNLCYGEVERPQLQPGHVLVKVHACGVAYRDTIERRGAHPFLQVPIIQGHEFAGEVVAVAPDVQRWKQGDRVLNLYTDSCGHCEQCIGGDERRCRNVSEAYGLTCDGGYAQYALVAERALEALPEAIDYVVGATLMSAAGVGYHNTVHTAGVGPGDTVLVTGASGGVGSAAIQAAKLMGATVYAVTGSQAKVAALQTLGADRVLCSDDGRFHKALLAERNGEGVDIAIDCVGTPTLNGSLRSLRPYGKVVVVGNVDGDPYRLNLGRLVVQALQILGSDNITRSSLRELMGLVAAGKITPALDRVLPLCRAAQAHRLLESRGAIGRIVLVPAPEGGEVDQ